MLFQVLAQLLDSQLVLSEDFPRACLLLVVESVFVRAKGVLLVARRKLLCQLLYLLRKVELVVAGSRLDGILCRIADQSGSFKFDAGLSLGLLVYFIESVQPSKTMPFVNSRLGWLRQ